MLSKALARAIVRLRYPLMAAMLLLAVLAAPNIARTAINYSLTDYLSEDTLTRRGLDIMNQEFDATSALTIGLAGDAGQGEALEETLSFARSLPGVLTAAAGAEGWDGGTRYTQLSLVTTLESAQEVYDRMEERLAQTPHLVSGEIRNNRLVQSSLNSEIPTVMLVSCLIVLAVLLVMGRSWLEPLLFFVDIAVSIVLNMGTNTLFPSISFITFAVAAILQLALAMDYSIMLMNAYDRQLDAGLSPVPAMERALSASFLPVFSSAMTTVAGMISLVFMSFTIGFDIGLVLAKGIVLSMLCVFLLMPGLLTLLTPLLRATRRRPLRLPAERLMDAPRGLRTGLSVFLLLLIAAGGVIQTGNRYTYTVRDMDADSAALSRMYGSSNQLVLLIPATRTDDDYERELAALQEIGELRLTGSPVVSRTYAMPVTAEAALRYYDADSAAELMGVSPGLTRLALPLLGIRGPVRGDELLRRALDAQGPAAAFITPDARLALSDLLAQLDLAQATFNGENWSRAILDLSVSYTDDGAPDILRQIREIMNRHYGSNWAVTGMLTATDDIATSFSRDIRLVSLITIISVFLIVCLSFRSLCVPALLVCVIQGAVWINMAYSGLRDGSVFFMCYLICMALQMGATIDYGILLTSHYRAARAELSPVRAAAQALSRSAQTILTSGLALITAGFAVGAISSVFYISSIGTMLGRGAIVSVALVVLLLPQLLIWLDRWVVRAPAKRENAGRRE